MSHVNVGSATNGTVCRQNSL